MKKSILKSIRGITVIALIITIIILVILATVSILALTGNNEIINQAINTRIFQHVAEIKEITELEIADIDIEDTVNEKDLSFSDRKDKVYEKLNENNLLYDTKIVENMVIVSNKYPVFLTSAEKPIELDKNLYDYQINQDSSAKITKYKGNEESIVIPSYVIEEDRAYVITTIGDQCFANNQSILEVEILDNIVEIGSWAFEKSNIRKITMTDSVKKLNYYGCFGNLEQLEEITISENITAITHSTFSNDKNLKKVNIPNSVTVIEDYAFINCYRMEEIIMPERLESIGISAFENVGYSGYGNNLKKIVLNEGLKTIGEKAFRSCHYIEEDLILPSTINDIGQLAFADFGVLTGKKVYYFDGTEY